MSKDEYLILNAGNIIDRNVPFNHIASKYIMKILAMNGVEVLGVGPQDLTLGRENLQKLIKKSPINVVCANLPDFLPYVRMRKNGGKLRVLITSVIDPQVMKAYHLDYDGEILDPVVALKKIEKEIEHDFFIVMIQAMGERVSAIINDCPGIDLAIDGLTLSIKDNLDQKGAVPLLSNNRRGQFVNYVEYNPSANKKLALPVRMRVSAKKVKEDLVVKAVINNYNKEKIEYSTKLRKKRSLEKLRQSYMKNPPNVYLGNRACEHCHAVSAKKWQQTRHANAMQILINKGRENDPECVKCHVTGMPLRPATNMDKNKNELGGFTSLSETPWMVNVQCEACHGPGARHAQNPLNNKMIISGEKSCRGCHTEETDPEFDYKKKIILIEHQEKRDSN